MSRSLKLPGVICSVSGRRRVQPPNVCLLRTWLMMGNGQSASIPALTWAVLPLSTEQGVMACASSSSSLLPLEIQAAILFTQKWLSQGLAG